MICRESRKLLCKNCSKSNIDVSRNSDCTKDTTLSVARGRSSRCRETLNDLMNFDTRGVEIVVRSSLSIAIVRSARAHEYYIIHLEPMSIHARVCELYKTLFTHVLTPTDETRANGRTLIIICISVWCYF